MVSSPEAMSEGSGTEKASSDKTVRPRQRTGSEIVPREPTSGSPGRATGSRRSSPAVREGSSTGRGSGESSGSGGAWVIRYSQKPVASVLASPPLKWAEVAERLKLDEDTVRRIVC